jgi:hypothetical protein
MDRLSIHAPLVLTLLFALAACGSGGGALRGQRVVDRVRVREVALPAHGSLGRCLASTPLRRGRVLVVERSGRVTRSVTVTQRGSRVIFACDKTGVRLEGREWCGLSAGMVRNGRIADPRLNILCRDADGHHVAAAFVNPVRGARWIGVEHGASTELYPTARGLPVRVSTTQGVDYERARATFRISQIGARGRVLARSRLVAQVAG